MRCSYCGGSDHERTYCPRTWQGSVNGMRAAAGAAPVLTVSQLVEHFEAMGGDAQIAFLERLRQRGYVR